MNTSLLLAKQLTHMFRLGRILYIRNFPLPNHVVASQVALATQTFRVVRSRACMSTLGAFFKTIALIIAGRAQFPCVYFANSLARGAAIQSLF